MPITAPEGYLDISNATLRGSEIITTSNVGIMNANPTMALSVGSNLHVNVHSSNVLQVSGNIVAEGLKIGFIEIVPSYDLAAVSNVGNTTTSTIQFANATTAFVTTSNAGIGMNTPAHTLDVAGDINLTSNIVMSSEVFIKAHDATKNYVAVGIAAGTNNQGYACVAVGYQAGQTSQGGSAIAIGREAGETSQGEQAIAVGRQAGKTSQGTSATAVGHEAGKTSQGTSAVAVGTAAGQSNQGSQATAVGYVAGATSQGIFATAVGRAAAQFNQGSGATAVGNGAGYTSQGTNAVAVGYQAGATSQGINAIAMGEYAGESNQGAYATAIGGYAGHISQGYIATAVGRGAGRTSQGDYAVAIGYDTAQTNQGDYATALGYAAGRTSQGAQGVAVGVNAGETAQGDYAVAVGREAGYNTQGSQATAVGYLAGSNNQGSYATAVGRAAGYSNQGCYSVAIGTNTAYDNQGSQAVAVGQDAGAVNQGTNAVALGRASGYSNQGASAVALGYTSGQYNQPASTFYCNRVRDANGLEYLHYNAGTGEITRGNSYSDDRLKYNEKVITGAIKSLFKLRPEEYDKKPSLKPSHTGQNWKRESGLIAQEIYYSAPEFRHIVQVPQTAGDVDKYTPPPSDDPNQDPDYSVWGEDSPAVKYEQFVPYLIKAVQEIVTELPRSKTTVSNAWGQNITGLVVSANVNAHKTNTTPIVALSNVYMDKKWYGVVSDKTTDTNDYDTLVDTKGDTQIWVTDVGGPLESGDLITTSNVAPGFTQKQGDDLLRSSTVAKVTQDCDFTEPTQRAIKVPKQELSNVTYYLRITEQDINIDAYEKLYETQRKIKTTPVYVKENERGEEQFFHGEIRVSEEKYKTLPEDEKSKKRIVELETDKYDELSDEEKAEYTLGTRERWFVVTTTKSKNPIPEHTEEIVVEELIDVLDENGQIVWEETGETEPVYTLVDHGSYKAALVSAKLV